MALFETWMTNDLQRIPKVETLYGNFFTMDENGNKLGVVVTNGGQAATLTGNVIGYIIRSDGNTVTVAGEKDGNRAWIILPQAAYAIEGEINVVIRLVNGNDKTVLCAVRTTVHRTSTDSYVDPGHIIPSIDELLEKIDEMETGTAAALSAASKISNLTATATALSSSANATATVTTVGSGSNAHFNIEFGIPRSPNDQTINAKVNKSGDTMTGTLKISGENEALIFENETDGQTYSLRVDQYTNAGQGRLNAPSFIMPKPAGGSEVYTLPNRGTEAGNQYFDILTSKAPVTVAQGGTGAATAAEARTNLGVTPANIGAKATQSAVSDPTASGNAVAFIDSITQNAQGVITPTKKTVQSASQSAAGLMSAADKTKLDGIAAGAQVNTLTGVKGNAESAYRTGNVNLTPENLGAVKKSGDTMTGFLVAPQLRVNSAEDSDPILNFLENGAMAATLRYENTQKCVGFVAWKSSGGDVYRLPTVDGEPTGNRYFDILTSKAPVTVAQGGTGAATAADARANLGCNAITANLGTITGTGSTVTVTKTVQGVTTDMTEDWVKLGTPSAVTGDITITTANNSVRFSAVVNGSTTVKVKLSHNIEVIGT